MEESERRPWQLFSWPRVGVVDVGSNAIRVTIAEVAAKEIREIESIRFSLRLGKEVFNNKHTLSSKTQDNLIDIFSQIKKIFAENEITLYRAMATAALRSARNRKRVLSRVLKHTGIKIELISPMEEGRLIGASLPKRHFAKRELLMDLGGGSLELAYYEKSHLKGITSLPLGAVRLLGAMKEKELPTDFLCRHIANICRNDPFVWKFTGHPPHNLFVVGSGGNIRALYRLRKRLLHRSCSIHPVLSLNDLAKITQKIEHMNEKQREKTLKLAKDRADVILPAAYAFYEILNYVGAKEIHIPMTVSLRRGTLVDVQRKLFG